jgi:zinc/manganese transport system substrate-binding protein
MRKVSLLALAALGFLAAPAHAVRVVTTLEDLASLAKEVGGARVQASSLARGYQDPHFVDAKPSLVLQLSRAELLIVAGLDLESGYLPPLLDQSRNQKIRPGSPGYLDASAGCEILGRPTQAVTRAMGDVHPLGNPHYWTDPENGRRIARSIAAKLGALDPAGAADYQRNLADFERRMDAKEKEWSALMAPHSGLKVVTFHDSWPNFAKRFGIQVAGHVEPKPGIPPSPTHTLAIINLMKAQNIRLILVEPYFDTKTPKYIAGKTAAKVLIFYPSVGGVPEIPDYLSLFDYNLNALVKALADAP